MFTTTCPTCSKKVSVDKREELPYRPFCSQRCKQVDLGRWLTEQYVVSEDGGSDRVVRGDDDLPFEPAD